MSDNRQRPRIHRTDDKHDKALRAYASEHGIEPWQALETAIQHLGRTVSPAVDAFDKAIADRNAAERQNDTLRTDLESAREATRRADAEVEATRRANKILVDRADAAEADVARLTREIAVATEAARVANADRARAEDVAKNAEASTAAAVRLVERREKELAAAITARASLADELASALEREQRAAATRPAPCACALPADLEPRLAAIAARRDVAPEIMLANVIKNGISKIEASDKYQDAQKAARGARA